MKITDMKVFQTSGGHANWTFVKLYTDEGVTGVGESSLEARDLEVKGTLEAFRPRIIGLDPSKIEMIWNMLYRSYWSGGAITMSAISGIEQALWDIKGKVLGAPVYELLGGKIRDKLRTYNNGWSAGASTLSDLTKKAQQSVEAGFTAMKWDPFGSAGQIIEKKDEIFAVESVRAVRQAVGPAIDLCIEAHGRFNMWSARRMADKLEEFDPFFYEEPLLEDNVDSLAALAHFINIPIATGERLYTRWQFRPLLEQNVAPIIQPDICHTGGILEMKKIAAMAETYYVSFQPHNSNGPISTLASMHLDACTPNFIIQEFVHSVLEMYNDILTDPIEYEGGYLMMSDRPGLGADIKEDVIASRPPRELVPSDIWRYPYY